ncbi:Major Facilitator Superfamily protein [Thalassovita gelatinovora]|uniref:Major Facilitator Superfamily protein n=1 Tax=Thalassovita gelatinovora TaxID=53501 RepID=A0A0P1G348_THAGE|nr:MFS transporter [Thalassovita gelatinovora]QIZ82153.1 MFS transporter [Thalassovita gelatinovora]CUH67750.1 Major Facilitator Superfamily protein [Thalassovita gelatinovora]SEP68183.1 Predicted arabinose efflux permease, MFS family [Thalassovita gelatinovora]
MPTANGLRLRVTMALVVIIAVTVAAFSVVTFRTFDEAIVPELRQRTKILGTMLRDDLQRTLELGIPIEAVAGFGEKAAEIVDDFPEVQRVRIVSSTGAVLVDINHEEANAPLKTDPGLQVWSHDFPVLVGNKIAAEIELTGNPRLIETRLLRALMDIAVIAFAIILLGVEMILALAARTIWLPRETVTRLLEDQRHGRFDRVIEVPPNGPLAQMAERLNDRAIHLAQNGTAPTRLQVSLPVSARLPVFLLALGTETTASFLPILAGSVERPEAITAPVAAALPLVFYLLSAAILGPIAGRLGRRIGPKRAFSWSVLPILVGLVVMAFSANLLGIALGRMAVGGGYTLAVSACSAFMLRAGGRTIATQMQASLNTALFGGVLAGSVIGGIAAFEAGYVVAILLGAGAVLAAYPVARWGLSGPAGQVRKLQPVAIDDTANRRAFVMFVAFLAVPASASTAMVIWYLVPLVLTAEGFDAAMIARIVMLYYLAAILIAPLASHVCAAARISDRLAAMGGAGVAAGTLIGAGADTLSPIAMVALLGVGHAVLRAPLYALVVRAIGQHTEWIDHFRVAERLGAVAAFATATLFLGRDNPAAIYAVLGTLSLAGLVLIVILTPTTTKQRVSRT